MAQRMVRVTMTLPETLYRRAHERVDNFSAFVAEAIDDKLRRDDFTAAIEATRGLLADTLADLNTSEEIVAFVHRQREGWNEHPTGSRA